MSQNGRYTPGQRPQPAADLSFLTLPTGHRTKHLRIDRFFNVELPNLDKNPFSDSLEPKLNMRVPVIVVLTILSGFPVHAAEESETSRLDRIKEELATRVRVRQKALGAQGVVFAPHEYSDSWLSTKRELKIDKEAIGFCGQTLATFARKEVMVSGRIAKKEISLYIESATGEEALAAFRKELDDHGIAVVSVGAHTLALVDAAEVLK